MYNIVPLCTFYLFNIIIIVVTGWTPFSVSKCFYCMFFYCCICNYYHLWVLQ